MCIQTYMDEHVLPFCFLTDKGAPHMALYAVQSITTSPFQDCDEGLLPGANSSAK